MDIDGFEEAPDTSREVEMELGATPETEKLSKSLQNFHILRSVRSVFKDSEAKEGDSLSNMLTLRA